MRRIWKEAVGKKVSFLPADAMVSPLREENRSLSLHNSNFPVLNWILVLDEFSLCLFMTFSSMKDRLPMDDKRLICYKATIGGIASNLYCLRALVTTGYDVQARGLARIISEHVDIFVLLSLRPDLAGEYHAAGELEAANAFWYKYVSKGKLRRLISEEAVKKNPALQGYFEQMSDYYKQEEEMTSTVIHPSFLASAMASYAGLSQGAGSPAGVLGMVDAVSVRTLRFVFYRIFELFIVARDTLFLCLAPENVSRRLNRMRTEARRRIDFVMHLGLYISVRRDQLPLSTTSSHR